MIYALLADLIVIIHFGFVLFAMLGGFLTLRWKKLLLLHLLAVAWAVVVEVFGLVCPLTPLENQFRRIAGQRGYEGDFVGQYLLPVLYPEQMTRSFQVSLGLAVLVINILIYVFVWKRWQRREG